jgi:trehalose-6-phosphatase
MASGSAGPRRLTAAEFAAKVERVLDDNPDAALLCAFDIDDTLKRSAATGAANVVPSGVVSALAEINGAHNRIFTAVATGRNPEDADRVFPGIQLATIAKDGGWIRDFRGVVKKYKMPPIPEFLSLGEEVLKKREPSGVFRINLGDAFGLSYPKGSHDREYAKDLAKFRDLEHARRGAVVIYEHTYATTREIIVQNGLDTKGTGVSKLRQALMKMGFRQVIVLTFGNSDNDESMHMYANSHGGLSFRISPGRTCARHLIVNLVELQGGLMLLANNVRKRGGGAPGRDDGAGKKRRGGSRR